MLDTHCLISNERGYSNEYLLEITQSELHAKMELKMTRKKSDTPFQLFKALPELPEYVSDAEERMIGLARTLQSNCRAGDFVARFGGEEFAVMFNADSDVKAQKILARFQENIRAMRFVAPDGNQVGITASFGAVQVDDTSIETLLEKADAALYQAKSAGRDRVSWA
ncbi:GGDEF domain-containing protein [Scandinavium sp. TWS1a]|uniref:GGDEF domain-containing protein n=1 Tax=Scandinavium tedordense TaxID=2926521 RepID=UPI0021664FCC|nr:GGDEF domain-containing protein [Scandinavium tedordense]MCS2169585.1 GGDEF domain-containing protein [Scandinavium tedordense]